MGSYAYYKRVNTYEYPVTGWFSFVIIKHLFNFIVVYKAFFSKKDMNISKKFSTIGFVCSFLANILLCYHFIKLMERRSVFWAPYILYEIVLQCMVWFQLIFDLMNWPKVSLMYQTEFFTNVEINKYQNNEDSGTFDEEEIIKQS